MTQQQRYTGPELSALLREVRAELGDQATIHEANRIRTGGLGGFFRKEGFEVLASPPASQAAAPASADTDGRSTRRFGLKRANAESAAGAGHLSMSDTLAADEELITKLTAAMESEQAWVDAIGASATPPPPTIEKQPARHFGPEDLAPIDDDFDRIRAATMLADHPSPGRQPAQSQASEPFLTPGQAMLERADSVSTQERVGQLLNSAHRLIDDPTIAERSLPTGRSVPPRGLMEDPDAALRFPGRLQRTNEHEPVVRRDIDLTPSSRAQAGQNASTPEEPMSFIAPATPAPRAERRRDTRATTPTPTADPAMRSIPNRAGPTRPDPASTAPGTANPETTTPGMTTPGMTITRTASPSSTDQSSTDQSSELGSTSPTNRSGDAGTTCFWDDLSRLESVLPIRPTNQASVQLLVGPLDIALPLATRFANDPSIGLSVFTEEVALHGIRTDQLADSSRDLHQRLLERAQTGARAIGVIEADDARRELRDSLDRMLTPRVLTMIDRVCADRAVDLLRLTLRSLGPIDELQELVESFAVPCAIDLHTAPSGAELDAALDAELPIVSIAGRQLTPALAMALKQR